MTEKVSICDADMVFRYEREEAAKGILSEMEIGEKGSQMLGRYLEKKWQQGEREPPAVLASGRVKRLPGSGEVSVSEWERWSKVIEEEGDCSVGGSRVGCGLMEE